MTSMPSGGVDTNDLESIWQSMLRLVHKVNLPRLREIAYLESNHSVFQLSTVGAEVFVTLSNDNYISRSLHMNGIYDFENFERAVKIIGRPITKLIDVGANIGTICIPALMRGYAQAAIAIEPEPLNFRTLRANIILNDLDGDIVAINTAVGERLDESLQFEISPDNKGDHRIRTTSDTGGFGEQNWETRTVQSTTIDSIAHAQGVFENKEGALLWIDVQGWESKALRGASELLRAGIPTVIEFWPYALERNGVTDELIETIVACCTQMYVISDPQTPTMTCSRDSFASLLTQMDRSNPLAACDLLLMSGEQSAAR